MDLAKYDDLIARILDEEHHIYPFLDVIFGFLWRRTDFFVARKEGGKLGFPPGGAEKIVLSVFKKWQNLSRGDTTKLFETESEKAKIEDVPLCASVVREEEVFTSEDITVSKDIDATKVVKADDVSTKKKDSIDCSDVYNGADRGVYRWSQTIVDLDVLIPIPECIKKSKEVNVSVTDSMLSVKVKDESDASKWKLLVNGSFCHRVNKEESFWSLLPGKHISIHCEKPEERWWDALLTCEPKLDTKRIDASRPMSELSEEEQMKVEELMWNEERKQLGLKTSEQIKAENVLKDAWNVEGSPFKGTEFDPSVLNIDTNSFNSIDFQGNG